jgi:nicotinamide mononucleotide adenylyltransferase
MLVREEEDEQAAEGVLQQHDDQQVYDEATEAAAAPGSATPARAAIPTRPGAEMSMYVEEVSFGDYRQCSFGYGRKRVSKVVFLKYLLKVWVPPSLQQEEMYSQDPAAQMAAENDASETLKAFMRHEKFKTVHMDWIAMENYAQKYHAGNEWSKWVSWCGEMAHRISTSSGTERARLVQEAMKRPNLAMPLEILQSLRQSCERTAGVEKNYGTPTEPNMIPGQGKHIVVCFVAH